MNPSTFSALAEPNRFLIVELLRDKPRAVSDIAATLHIRQPQVSKHLRVLADAGIVAVRPQANQRIYELSPQRFKELYSWLEKYRNLWKERFNRLDQLLMIEKKEALPAEARLHQNYGGRRRVKKHGRK